MKARKGSSKSKSEKPEDAPRISARMRTVRLEEDGKTLQMTFTAETIDGRSGPVPADFDPWTADFEALIGDTPDFNRFFSDPKVSQVVAAQLILSLREGIQNGQVNVLDGLALAVRNGIYVPDWLCQAFVSRYSRYQRFECRTLDEAFGVLPLKPRALAAARRRKTLRERVSTALFEVIHDDPSQPIDEGLFETTASKLGIGARQCEELYYEGVRKFGMQDLKDLKHLVRNLRK